MDLAASRFGLDRAEIRRRNLVKPSAMPFTTPTGGICDCGDFPRLMESALRYADWAGFPARKAEAAKRGRLRGIGVVYTIEGAGGMAQEYAIAEAKPDGTIVVGIGSQSQGQGHETTFAQLAAETLDVPFDKVRIVAGDTDKIAQGWGTFASRSMIRAGGAAFEAMQLLIAEGRSRASAYLEASAEDIVYSGGRFVVAGTDRSVGLDELAACSRSRPRTASERQRHLAERLPCVRGRDRPGDRAVGSGTLCRGRRRRTRREPDDRARPDHGCGRTGARPSAVRALHL